MPSLNIPSFYRDVPLGVRLHVAMRWRLFDFSALADFVPSEGIFVDVGCGYGLWAFYLAHLRPTAEIWGIDPDIAKIGIARALAQSATIDNMRFEVGYAENIKFPECALISMIDVMYLIPFKGQEEILAKAASQLQPGGRLLLKEMGQNPRWKYIWNWVEEWLAVCVLRITQGKHFHFRSDEEWEKLLRSLGLRVKTLRLDINTIHPHLLFVGEKP